MNELNRRRTLAALTLAVAALVAAPTPAPAGPLSLEDSLRLALANQPSLAGARARVDAAAAQVELVDVEARPTITASAGYNVGVAAGQGLTDPSQAASAGVTGAWLLWDFGKLAARRDAAQAGVVADQVALTQTEQALLQQVELAYAQVVGTAGQAQIRIAAVEAETRHVAETERQVVAGTRTAVDTAQARARLASARLAQVQADNAVALAVAELERAVGAPLPAGATFPAAAVVPVAGEAGPLDELVAAAVRADPSAAALAAQRQAQALTRRATAISTRPTLAATAGLGVNALGTYGVPPDTQRVAATWNVGMNLSWQLYDGGARAAQVRAADATLRRVDADLAARQVELRYQVSAARLDVTAAKAQRVAADDSVAAAGEQLRLAEARTASGLGSSAELADAQDAVTQAQGDVVAADYQLATARARLRSLLGTSATLLVGGTSNP
ncbi:MAG: TolC family protein [Kofleriaceae bacterium]